MESVAKTQRPYWPALWAGAALGLVLLAAFLITGHGLGASGSFTRLTAFAGSYLAPEVTAANASLGPYLRGNPLSAWIVWEAAGIFLGGLISGVCSGRFRIATERGPGISRKLRLVAALGGGVLVGVGARFARGCTSGLGLSGSATLAVAAYIFLTAFFVVGLATMMFARRLWK